MQKTTHTYATHGIPLECDVYARPGPLSSSPASPDSPVFLFFHAGGLVCCGRDRIPPWLVQVCLQRGWPLISASYRLMPQPGGAGLVEDVSAAYAFAQAYQAPAGKSRRVIVGGASAGFFMTTLVAHHCSPPPLALLSICGIASFTHPFFTSSTLLSDPIPDGALDEHIAGPPVVGVSDPATVSIFSPEMLLPDGFPNRAYVAPAPPPKPELPPGRYERGMLYEYYTARNAWAGLLGPDVDPGYAWALDTNPEARARRARWPRTSIFHGDADVPVPLGVSEEMRRCLGDRVRLFVAPGMDHLFEQKSFIEDEGAEMDAVRAAVRALDENVAAALAE
jgi:acetyl esterase/lipase